MDENQTSRYSGAGEKRKRRSSILKSQRPPRTPLSELEFHVTTPTDTAKSRRVSFSKRTGVAEFVTNEATNTWKNFYEEQNKSLESSINEPAINPPRQTIGHLGQRIFDQQFQEVEVVDFGGSILPSNNYMVQNVNQSHSINFTQQFALLECDGDDRKLSVPQHNFELSSLTDHRSKIFGDDLTIPTIGEVSKQININFSVIQPITAHNNNCDDLDEIEKDLGKAQSNIVCQGPFDKIQNISEYIAVDLNTTHVALTNVECDMSITDTIQSPKVQELSKHNHSAININKFKNKADDWIVDKENIAINPYVAPKESANFSLNESQDQVLVFDGKKLTIQSNKNDDIKIPKQNYRQTLLPNLPSDQACQRKTIVLNMNDDLPNFVNNTSLLKDVHGISINANKSEMNQSKIFNESGMSVTEAVPNKIEILGNEKNTIISEGSNDVSITHAISSNMILLQRDQLNEKRQTIIFENDTSNLSITEAVPSHVLALGKNLANKTMVYENDTGNLSMTQAIPSHVLVHGKDTANKTMVYENDTGNLSMTQAIPSHVLVHGKDTTNKTMVYENDTGNLSMTQAIPSNVLALGKDIANKTMVYENDTGNLSMTQAIPSNVLALGKDIANKTMVYENDTGNLSITQALPSHVLAFGKQTANKIKDKENDTGNLAMTQVIPTHIVALGKDTANKTMVYENETGNLSMTQAIPSHVLAFGKDIANKTMAYENDTDNLSITKALPSHVLALGKQTANKINVFENDSGNLSITQAIPTHILALGKDTANKTMVYENDTGNLSMTQAIPSNVLALDKDTVNKTTVYENDTGNLSMTQVIPSHVLAFGKHTSNKIKVNENDTGNSSITQAISTHVLALGKDTANKTMVYENDAGNLSMTQAVPLNVLALGKDTANKTTVNENDTENLSMTQAIPSNVLAFGKDIANKTRVYENNTGNLSITQAIHSHVLALGKDTANKTMVYENNTGNLSMTQAIPSNLLSLGKDTANKSTINENDTGNLSMVLVNSSHVLALGKDGTNKTMVYENDTGNLSMIGKTFDNNGLNNQTMVDETGRVSFIQVLPRTVMLMDEANDTNMTKIKFPENNIDISFTQPVSANMLFSRKSVSSEKRKTISDNISNNSVTCGLPANISEKSNDTNISLINLKSEKRDLDKSKIIMPNNDKDAGDNISMTKSVNESIELDSGTIPHRRETLDHKNIINTSMTQVLPANILISNNVNGVNTLDIHKSFQIENSAINNISSVKSYNEKKISLVKSFSDNTTIDGLRNNTCNMDQLILSNAIDSEIQNKTALPNDNKTFCEKLNDEVMTENISNKSRNIDYEVNIATNTDAVTDYKSTYVDKIPHTDKTKTEKLIGTTANTIEKDCEFKVMADSSVDIKKDNVLEFSTNVLNNKNQTKIDNINHNLSLSDSVPENVISPRNEKPFMLTSILQSLSKNEENFETFNRISVQDHMNNDVFVYQAVTSHNVSKHQSIRIDQNDSRAAEKIIDDEKVSNASSTKTCFEVCSNKENEANFIIDEPDISVPITKQLAMQNETEIQIEIKNTISDRKSINTVLSEKSRTKNEHKMSILNVLLNMSKGSTCFSADSVDDKHSTVPMKIQNVLKEDEGEENAVAIGPNGFDNLEKRSLCKELYEQEKPELLSNFDLTNLINEEKNRMKNNRHFEKVVRSDEIENFNNEGKNIQTEKSEEYAHSINNSIEIQEKSVQETKDTDVEVENKNCSYDSKRQCFSKSRTFVLSREDLLNNITMAQAALQQASQDSDDSDCMYSFNEHQDEEIDENTYPVPSVRLSAEVVKALHFEDDDSMNEINRKDQNMSALKKAINTDTTYTRHSNVKVIPSYLKDATEGVKALMQDLVKPLADTMPFESSKVDKFPENEISKCAIETQANLISSSQINVDTVSNSESDDEAHTENLSKDVVNSAYPIQYTKHIEKNKQLRNENTYDKSYNPSINSNQVLVFDSKNPLNNVILSPRDFSSAHKYNPISEALNETQSNKSPQLQQTYEKTDKTEEYYLNNSAVVKNLYMQTRGTCSENMCSDQSLILIEDLPKTVELLTIASDTDIKESEPNHLITIESNNDLIEGNPSLILDKNVTTHVTEQDDSSAQESLQNSVLSPLEVKFKKDNKPSADVENAQSVKDISSNTKNVVTEVAAKAKKRIYSPMKRNKKTNKSPEVTPKPINKMQKFSSVTSVETEKCLNKSLSKETDKKTKCVKKLNAASTVSRSAETGKDKNRLLNDLTDKANRDLLPDQSSSISNATTEPFTNVTVQRLITSSNSINKEKYIPILEDTEDYESNSSITHPTKVSQIKSSVDRERINSSNVNVKKDKRAKIKVKSDAAPNKHMDRSLKMSECDAGANVIAKIDVLPFMGSPECEWEASVMDKWRFLLLHERIRLEVRMEHRYSNSPRRHVRADTPVLATTIELTKSDKDVVVSNAVRLAADAMRLECEPGALRAGEVPSLLERCSGIARAAIHWAKAMHYARIHLAYTLSYDGHLSLNVAIIPLRTVWKVTMRLELIRGEGGKFAWPRASDVRVRGEVVKAVQEAVNRLPRDWDHVPNAIWKIFRNLKQKTDNDEILFVV